MKPYTITAAVMVVLLALIPPIDFFISIPYDEKWLYLVALAGFLGVFTLFIDTPPAIRIIAIGSFVNCFFSSAPYISFTSYISVVACCYFFIVCTRIESWKAIFKVLQSILLLNMIIITMQFFGKDSLLNFGLDHNIQFGTIGQHMQMGSFAVILAAFLISFNRYNFIPPFLISLFCGSVWAFAASAVGAYTFFTFKDKSLARAFLTLAIMIFVVFGIVNNKFEAGLSKASGRAQVWKRTIELANKKPLTGYGIGTYKLLFPPLSKMKCVPYKTAHNCPLQILFEAGYPGLIFVLFLAGALIQKLWDGRKVFLLCGFFMIAADMLVHFPDRMAQSVLIIVCFLAFCQRRIQDGRLTG